MNMAPGGTGALIAMRSEIASCLRGEPELKLLDTDLRHLFASWFNRGFLELRRIDWQSPAAVLEKLIAYEAVHAIKGWDDLRRRLAPDRRCFAFFHPALPGEPLIFVEVALVEGLATSMPPLLSQDVEEDTALGRVYLPQDELTAFGVEELAPSPEFRELMAFEAERARACLAEGLRLLDSLDRRSALCVGTFAGLYRETLDRIEAAGFDVFGEKTRLSAPRKLAGGRFRCVACAEVYAQPPYLSRQSLHDARRSARG